MELYGATTKSKFTKILPLQKQVLSVILILLNLLEYCIE